MNRKRIALITSRKWNVPVRCDRLLAGALCSAGIHADILCWEDPHPWTSYDLLILRSCWDYHLHYADFCRWLAGVKESGAHIANGVNTIEVNIDKVQQMTLLRKGSIPVIPSLICTSMEEAYSSFRREHNGRAVIKPSVSASGYHTSLVRNEQELICAARPILEDGKKIILQPYVEAVQDGEMSMIYYHGIFSHAVRRCPGITADKHAPCPVNMPDSQWLEAADTVSSEILAEKLLYARIDLISYRGAIHIMEVELAEPDLYLDLGYSWTPSPLERFVEHIQQEMLSPASVESIKR